MCSCIFVVPLDETNEQFFNTIYTGQKVSFGKIHKEYQGTYFFDIYLLILKRIILGAQFWLKI